MKEVFQFINGAQFHKQYCPGIKRFKHKLWGKDSNGKTLDFTPADKAAIRDGLIKMHEDLLRQF